MAKMLAFNEEAWEYQRAGAEKVYEAVKATLGPRGHNVVINDGTGAPTITKDGVTVAKAISLKDPFEDTGAQLIKEIASKTNDVAGDGTTTSTVLGYEIFSKGLKHISKGVNPAAIKRGIDKAIDAAITDIVSKAKPVSTEEEIAQVAMISANNDAELGGLIASAMAKVGIDGVITVEESRTEETSLTVVEGMQFDKGYISPHMAANAERGEVVLQDPYILLTNQKISTVQDFLAILEGVMQAKKPLLIIADDVEGEALNMLVVNNLRGIMNVVAIKPPGFGDRRKAILKDLAVLTGGVVIDPTTGIDLATAGIGNLGRAKMIKVTRNSTTILEGAGDPEIVDAHIESIRAELDNVDSQYDNEMIRERLAKLAGGVAVLRAGAATETELKEKKHRIEDALAATAAAVAEGIVIGGGTTLVKAIPVVEALMNATADIDEKAGMLIVIGALESPLIAIANNAGERGELICEKVKELKGNLGFNALTRTYEDLLIAGVVDPVMVVRTALKHAGSIASMLLTTSVLIVNDPEEQPPAGMSGMGMPGMM